jgi:hypothetical protein
VVLLDVAELTDFLHVLLTFVFVVEQRSLKWYLILERRSVLLFVRARAIE